MRVSLALLCTVTWICVGGPQHVAAEDIGAFEGALWRFTLEPKNQQQEKLGGMFRVSKGVLYQKENPRATEIDQVAGSETLVKRKGPNGARLSRLNFTNLRAFSTKKNFDGDRNAKEGIQGSVFMHQEKFGKWSGAFVAADGRHWTFSCTRVRE